MFEITHAESGDVVELQFYRNNGRSGFAMNLHEPDAAEGAEPRFRFRPTNPKKSWHDKISVIAAVMVDYRDFDLVHEKSGDGIRLSSVSSVYRRMRTVTLESSSCFSVARASRKDDPNHRQMRVVNLSIRHGGKLKCELSSNKDNSSYLFFVESPFAERTRYRHGRSELFLVCWNKQIPSIFVIKNPANGELLVSVRFMNVDDYYLQIGELPKGIEVNLCERPALSDEEQRAILEIVFGPLSNLLQH